MGWKIDVEIHIRSSFGFHSVPLMFWKVQGSRYLINDKKSQPVSAYLSYDLNIIVWRMSASSRQPGGSMPPDWAYRTVVVCAVSSDLWKIFTTIQHSDLCGNADPDVYVQDFSFKTIIKELS